MKLTEREIEKIEEAVREEIRESWKMDVSIWEATAKVMERIREIIK